MGWTYSYDPSKSDRDWIRWRIGDTASDGSHYLQDTEIDGALATYGSKYRAAMACALSIAGKLSGKVDSRMGKLAFDYSQQAAAFRKLADDIRGDLLVAGNAAPWAAAHKKSRKETNVSDSDRVEPAFVVGMHDFPETDETVLST